MNNTIGDYTGIDIKVIRGFNKVIYSGLVDEAPITIKLLKYIRTEPDYNSSKLVFVVE